MTPFSQRDTVFTSSQPVCITAGRRKMLWAESRTHCFKIYSEFWWIICHRYYNLPFPHEELGKQSNHNSGDGM